MKGDIVDKDEYAVDGRTRLIARSRGLCYCGKSVLVMRILLMTLLLDEKLRTVIEDVIVLEIRILLRRCIVARCCYGVWPR